MITFVLFIFAHVGPMGSGNSNALATQEFNSKQTCEAAAKVVKSMATGTVKAIEAVCVQK